MTDMLQERIGNMRIIYYIYSAHGLRGCIPYTTREEAQAAADFRTNCTGMKWYVEATAI